MVSHQRPRLRTRSEQALTTFARDFNTFYIFFLFTINVFTYLFASKLFRTSFSIFVVFVIRELNSIIMSVEMYPEPADVLLENITLVFKHIKVCTSPVQ